VSEPEPIVLDGSVGEGGGQILRTALSLAAITGRPFSIRRIRANRIKPGLRPQHRAATLAAAQLCRADVEGAEVGSDKVTFHPGAAAEPGEHTFDIGTAGSGPLLLQTICWPLALQSAPSHLTIKGGTHLAYSPTFHYLAMIWAPAVARLGFRVEPTLTEAGFYPQGGGEFSVRVYPAHPMPPLDLRNRGTLHETEVVSMVGGLGFEVADRQAQRAIQRLKEGGVSAQAESVPVPARASRGSHVLVVGTFERTRSGCGAIGATGEKGVSPERVADEAAQAFRAYLSSGAAVDLHLGDQLLLPAALCAAGVLPAPPGVVPATRYTVSAVTKHLTTNAEVIRRFLDVDVAVIGREGEEGEVRVTPPGASVEVMKMPGR
jgi:RNA 3'-terminal phosphate cyclase (ATP)